MTTVTPQTAAEFVAACANTESSTVRVLTRLDLDTRVYVAPGVAIHGDGHGVLAFAAGTDGLRLSAGNTVQGLTIRCDAAQQAISNDPGQATLATIRVRHVTTTGCVRLVATESVTSGTVIVDDLTILDADAGAFGPRPTGFNVEVIHGAFTLANLQADPASVLYASVSGVSVGRPDAPVKGSGVFVTGAGQTGGQVRLRALTTGDIYSDGQIPQGTAGVIAAGVFTGFATHTEHVENTGTVTTFGVNDMVLDNWGEVIEWTAHRTLTSHGASGVGFVNFGRLDKLDVQAPIETFGQGARGFNVYDGHVGTAHFDRIVTHGDGSVGVQVSKPMNVLEIDRGIETYGGVGDTLVKGVIVKLAAVPLSVKAGGSIGSVDISGGLHARGADVPSIENLGTIESIVVTGGATSATDSGDD